jgi:hypothetical protein
MVPDFQTTDKKTMAKTPASPQQGSNPTQPQQQQQQGGGAKPTSQQQGGTIFRDWASI